MCDNTFHSGTQARASHATLSRTRTDEGITKRRVYDQTDPTSPCPAPTSLGERFLQARKERGLTQAELAAPTLTASYISHIESGKSRPSLKTLAVLAQRLDYPMQYFIGGDTEATTVTDTATDQARTLLKARLLLATGQSAACVALLRPLVTPERFTDSQLDVLLLLGRAESESGDVAQGIQTLEEARSLAINRANPVAQVQANVALGTIHHNAGHLAAALEYFQTADRVLRASPMPDPLLHLETLAGYAGVLFALGEADAGLWLYTEGAALAAQVCQPRTLAALYGAINESATDGNASTRERTRAFQMYADGLGDLVRLHLTAANAAVEQDSVACAQAAFADALQVSTLAGDPAGRAAALVGQARLALVQHDPNRARDLAQAVDTEGAEGADAETHVQRELVLAEAEAALDNPAVAETHFRAALEGAKDKTTPTFWVQSRLPTA